MALNGFRILLIDVYLALNGFQILLMDVYMALNGFQNGMLQNKLQEDLVHSIVKGAV